MWGGQAAVHVLAKTTQRPKKTWAFFFLHFCASATVPDSALTYFGSLSNPEKRVVYFVSSLLCHSPLQLLHTCAPLLHFKARLKGQLAPLDVVDANAGFRKYEVGTGAREKEQLTKTI